MIWDRFHQVNQVVDLSLGFSTGRCHRIETIVFGWGRLLVMFSLEIVQKQNAWKRYYLQGYGFQNPWKIMDVYTNTRDDYPRNVGMTILTDAS